MEGYSTFRPVLFIVIQEVLGFLGSVAVILTIIPWTLLPVIPLTMILVHYRTKFTNLQTRIDKCDSAGSVTS